MPLRENKVVLRGVVRDGQSPIKWFELTQCAHEIDTLTVLEVPSRIGNLQW